MPRQWIESNYTKRCDGHSGRTFYERQEHATKELAQW